VILRRLDNHWSLAESGAELDAYKRCGLTGKFFGGAIEPNRWLKKEFSSG